MHIVFMQVIFVYSVYESYLMYICVYVQRFKSLFNVCIRNALYIDYTPS